MRNLQDAMKNARRLEAEIPQLAAPGAIEYDMVLLAREVKQLRVLCNEICSDEALLWCDCGDPDGKYNVCNRCGGQLENILIKVPNNT